VKVVFIGSGDIGLRSLEWLLAAPDTAVLAVVTQPDRAAGRGMAMRHSRIKELALSRGVEVFQPRKIREPEAVAHVASLQPDLLVVMAYGQILPQSLLDVPRLGALNLHASLLPRHRGAAPVHAAILSGDRKTGITSMWMDAGLDTGDMLLQREIEMAADETAGSLHDQIAALAPKVLAESLGLIREGRAPRLKQDESLATYAPKLDRATGRIDWSRSADELARRMRAMHPWPGSSADLCLADGKVVAVKIHAATAFPGSSAKGLVADGFLVGCGGGGVLQIASIQAAGGRVMSGEEFLRGHRPSYFLSAPDNGEQAQQQQQQ
jgi:methionyl-tRNA formyltransferase